MWMSNTLTVRIRTTPELGASKYEWDLGSSRPRDVLLKEGSFWTRTVVSPDV